MGDVAEPGCSAGNDAKMGTGIDTGMRGDADRSEEAESKVDITMPKKTNKVPILVSY